MQLPGAAGSSGVMSVLCNRASVAAPVGLSASARAIRQVGSPTMSSGSSGSGNVTLGVAGGGCSAVPMFWSDLI
jgi:hypothetical protein